MRQSRPLNTYRTQISGDTNLFGDGMGIFLTKERKEPGPIYGFKSEGFLLYPQFSLTHASLDKFEGLGIFLDTYANARHSFSFPRVIGYVGDGEHEYDYGNDGDGQDIGGCSVRFAIPRSTICTNQLQTTYRPTSVAQT